MASTSIEWSEQVWNPLVGCTIKSPGCLNCYAMRMAARLALMGQKRYEGATIKINGKTVWSGLVTPDEDALTIPLRRKKPTTWFVNSMSDLFWGDAEDLRQAKTLGVADPQPVPFDFIDKVFAVMALCPQHTFQVLTKRTDRMAEYMSTSDRDESIGHAAMQIYEDSGGRGDTRAAAGLIHGPGDPRGIHRQIGLPAHTGCWPLPNLWLGTSIENQATADERIPHLLRVPAAVRFLSVEPLLGPIDLSHFHIGWSECDECGEADDPSPEKPLGMPMRGAWDGEEPTCSACGGNLSIAGHHLHWVIVGGESGPGARPCIVEWIRSIVGQCKAAQVPVFVKQLGSVVHTDIDDSGWGKDWTPLYPRDEIRKTTLLGYRVHLKDSKGGDPSEWPQDLRVREMPESAVGK